MTHHYKYNAEDAVFL